MTTSTLEDTDFVVRYPTHDVALTPEETDVLLTLLEFHIGLDDEEGGPYPLEPFRSLCLKMGFNPDNV